MRTLASQQFPFRRHSRRRFVIALLGGLAVALTAPLRASGLIVFDPSNYSQTLLTAARALEQIQNQIKSLQNEAQMLINQAKNLTQMPHSLVAPLKSDIDAINRLMAQGQGIAFQVQHTADEFARLYPRAYGATVSANQMVQDAQGRWNNTYEALKQTLLAQSKIVESVERDGENVQTLLTSSSGAIGTLQAQQAGNELLALQIKQALQTQALVAAQARAEALKSAEEKIGAEAAKQRYTRFVGDGKAYAR